MRRRRRVIGFYTEGKGKNRKVRPITAPVKRRLKRIHRRRSLVAQRTDEALEAKPAPSAEAWIRRPNRYDVEGVDKPEKKIIIVKTQEKQVNVKYPEFKELDLGIYGKPIDVSMKFVDETASLNNWRKTYENTDSIAYGYASYQFVDKRGNVINVDISEEGRKISFWQVFLKQRKPDRKLAEFKVETYYKQMRGVGPEGKPEYWTTEVATVKKIGG